MKRSVPTILFCSTFGLAMACAPGSYRMSGIALGQARAAADAVVKTVPLTPGTCATVSNGDTITLDWNPGFEHPGVVTGMRHFELAFARSQDKERAARVGAPLHLVASPRIHGELPGQPSPEIEPAANGMFHIRFHPDLRNVEPGEYNLIAAQAIASTAEDMQGNEPAMTNSPLNSPFCLDVIASPDGRRGR